MDGMYGLHTSVDYGGGGGGGGQPSAAEAMATPADYQNYLLNSGCFQDRIFESDHIFGSASASASTASIQPDHQEGEEDVTRFIKAKIASHPLYPTLLQAYIDCHKVGAPPEIDGFLEQIKRQNAGKMNEVSTTRLGTDPELDEFMETYCDILVKYKSDLARPFDEASSFLCDIQLQLSNLCKGASRIDFSEEAAGSSEDDCSGGESEIPDFQPRSDERDLKDKLMRKYSGYISSLKQDFARKKKKGKLPKEARQVLLEWWNMHYKWPYPTEGDKVALAESTGLDQKQINNWFINQRKRHWKPSENMQFAVMDTLSAPFFIYE